MSTTKQMVMLYTTTYLANYTNQTHLYHVSINSFACTHAIHENNRQSRVQWVPTSSMIR